MTEKRLTKEWEVSAFDRESNEWTTTMNHAYEAIPDIPDFINQAAPTRITPSRRTKPTTEHDTTLFIGDTQFPFQNDRALDLAMVAVKEFMPGCITFCGDDIDAPNFSSFEQRSEWAGSLQSSLDQFHEYLSRIRAESPDSKIVVHEGNHNARIEREVRRYNGELIGLKRARSEQELSVLSLGFLMRFDELGVEYVTGYPNAEYWHEDDIKSFHGTKAVTRGSTMASVIQNETVSCIQGHSNRAEIVYRTLMVGREERQIFGMNPGTTCDFDKIPSGKRADDQYGNPTKQRHNWQTAIGVLFHNEETASPHLLPITNEGIQIFDKLYRG